MAKLGEVFKTKEERLADVAAIKQGTIDPTPQPPEAWIANKEHLKPLLGQAIKINGHTLASVGQGMKYIKYAKKNKQGVLTGQTAEFVNLYDDGFLPVEKFRIPAGNGMEWRIVGQVRLNAKLVKAGEVDNKPESRQGVEF